LWAGDARHIRITVLLVIDPAARSSPMFEPRNPQYRIRVIHEAPVDAEWDSMWCFAMSPLCAWAACER
jgi:hypothetical protein